jgi:hypothetical protein
LHLQHFQVLCPLFLKGKLLVINLGGLCLLEDVAWATSSSEVAVHL